MSALVFIYGLAGQERRQNTMPLGCAEDLASVLEQKGSSIGWRGGLAPVAGLNGKGGLLGAVILQTGRLFDLTSPDASRSDALFWRRFHNGKNYLSVKPKRHSGRLMYGLAIYS